MSLVLWADDDGEGSLRALESLLERRGLKIEKFVDFSSARDWIESHRTSDDLAGVALLVDAILPRTRETGSLPPYIGLKLARLACEASIGAVCFLTVVRREEIEEALQKLRQQFGERTHFEFVSKLDLLDNGMVENLARFLAAPGRRLEAR